MEPQLASTLCWRAAERRVVVFHRNLVRRGLKGKRETQSEAVEVERREVCEGGGSGPWGGALVKRSGKMRTGKCPLDLAPMESWLALVNWPAGVTGLRNEWETVGGLE